MAALYLIIGGIGGGVLGWLLDRRGKRVTELNPQTEEACETNT